MSYYDRDYYVTGTKSNYGGRFLPYTDKLNLIHTRGEARIFFDRWHPNTSLELGCATGNMTMALRELGVEAYGIDISKWAIENADTYVKPFLKIGDITTELTKYKDREFDIVLALDVLEHIDKTNLKKTIEEICRITKNNILLEVPIIDNGVDKSHVSILPASWWSTQFTIRKFKIISSGFDKAPDGLTNFQAILVRKIN